MLQVRDLVEIKDDPKKVEELLNDDEKELLNHYEKLMKRASAGGFHGIVVKNVPEILVNLLRLNGYTVYIDEDLDYNITWSCDNIENFEVGSFDENE